MVTKDTLAQIEWVNRAYADMSLEEKIGQLFMVSIGSNEGGAASDKISSLIKEHHVGGVIFLKGEPHKQLKLTNRFQSESKTPLLIGMDAEWGLAMRLDSTYAFPWNMTLGAIQDNNTVEKVGFQIGKHAKRIGVHINFAPDIDVNNNPRNPIIGNRSFGESPENVAEKGLAIMNGMQAAGVLACGKHFPGHGDTDVDSHKALPIIDADRQRLDSIELNPFKHLIKNGLGSVMVAHLDVPCLESREGHPSSLSKSIISDLLIKELGF
ncbi:MAG: glycoside hydrolase family 3 N-terminal domain-containing protein, partial [Bacteroidota bacterium]